MKEQRENRVRFEIRLTDSIINDELKSCYRKTETSSIFTKAQCQSTSKRKIRQDARARKAILN